MTDKDKLLELLKTVDGNLEDILPEYIARYGADFDTQRLYHIMQIIQEQLLCHIISDEHALKVSLERATYLSNYFKGNMYTTYEATLKHLPLQAQHADAIVNVITTGKDNMK